MAATVAQVKPPELATALASHALGNARSVLLYLDLDYDRLVAPGTVNGDGPIEVLGSHALNAGH